MKVFNLPDLGEGLPDAEISEWHVKIGDKIKEDQPLVSMETAKALVEVPSPYSGIITKTHGEPGDIIKTGAPLVEFDTDSATVAGHIETGDFVLEEQATGVVQTKTSGVKAIPAVRALAKKLNVDLVQIKPSDPEGQITADDVKKAASTQDINKTNVHVKPLRGTRRAMATALAQSHMEVVPVTLFDDVDIHAWPKDTDITIRIVRALIQGCITEPALNAHFDKAALERHLFDAIHLGVAMDSKEGLFVPVLQDVASMSNNDIRKTINRFKKEVETRTISKDELEGSTIQLTNFGCFAGRYANPIIIPPIVAILGAGHIRDNVVAYKGEVVIHRILPLSLTIDHRAVTGGEAARFLAAVIRDLVEKM